MLAPVLEAAVVGVWHSASGRLVCQAVSSCQVGHLHWELWVLSWVSCMCLGGHCYVRTVCAHACLWPHRVVVYSCACIAPQTCTRHNLQVNMNARGQITQCKIHFWAIACVLLHDTRTVWNFGFLTRALLLLLCLKWPNFENGSCAHCSHTVLSSWSQIWACLQAAASVVPLTRYRFTGRQN